MENFYSETLLAAWKKRENKYLAIAGGMMLAGLLICVFLCTKVRTGNASLMLAAVIALSCLSGWAAMGLMFFGYAPARAQRGHIAGIRAEEMQEYSGEIRLTPMKVHIPRSIDICKVQLTTGEETLSFHINACLVKYLPANGTQVRLRVARKFVTGCEVIA